MPSQQTITLIAQYQAQVDDILDVYVAKTGHLPACPAEALTGVIRMLNWGLKFTPLPVDRVGECHRTLRLIRITADLDQRLEHPGVARKVAHAAIAHELAHAVLHSEPRRSRVIPKSWEWEANLWAACFLVPYRYLAGRPELEALRGNCLTQRERWQKVQQLASDFQVTVSFMRVTLVQYGVIEMTEGNGIQAPADILVKARRPWKVA